MGTFLRIPNRTPLYLEEVAVASWVPTIQQCKHEHLWVSPPLLGESNPH
jgi:hypothetical protein